jgi:hypothetical protein
VRCTSPYMSPPKNDGDEEIGSFLKRALKQEIAAEVRLAEEQGVGEKNVRTGVQASIIVGHTSDGHEIHA